MYACICVHVYVCMYVHVAATLKMVADETAHRTVEQKVLQVYEHELTRTSQ